MECAISGEPRRESRAVRDRVTHDIQGRYTDSGVHSAKAGRHSVEASTTARNAVRSDDPITCIPTVSYANVTITTECRDCDVNTGQEQRPQRGIGAALRADVEGEDPRGASGQEGSRVISARLRFDVLRDRCCRSTGDRLGLRVSAAPGAPSPSSSHTSGASCRARSSRARARRPPCACCARSGRGPRRCACARVPRSRP